MAKAKLNEVDLTSVYDTIEAGTKSSTRKTRSDKRVSLRINMSFDKDTEQYLRTISDASGTSMTEYVNNLVRADMLKNVETYAEALALKNKLKK